MMPPRILLFLSGSWLDGQPVTEKGERETRVWRGEGTACVMEIVAESSGLGEGTACVM